MQNITIQLLAIFIVGAILKTVAHMIFGGGIFGTGIGVLIEIAILGYVYLILKQYRYLNLKKIMSFLGGITAVSIFIDIGLLRPDFGNLIILGIIAWMLFGKGGFFSSRRGRGW